MITPDQAKALKPGDRLFSCCAKGADGKPWMVTVMQAAKITGSGHRWSVRVRQGVADFIVLSVECATWTLHEATAEQMVSMRDDPGATAHANMKDELQRGTGPAPAALRRKQR